LSQKGLDVIKGVVEKYDKTGKVAFNKADNARVFIHLTFRTDEDKEEWESSGVDIAKIKSGEEEPNVIEMIYGDFVFKYKPKMIWYNKSGNGTYSALMGKYMFARGYKVVLMRIRFLSYEDVREIIKLSKNIYPISFRDYEFVPSGLILFVPD